MHIFIPVVSAELSFVSVLIFLSSRRRGKAALLQKMEEPVQSLFSEDELNAIKTSWQTLTLNGITPVGQLVLQR